MTLLLTSGEGVRTLGEKGRRSRGSTLGGSTHGVVSRYAPPTT